MRQRGWVPDEIVHAGAEHLDPAYVAAYDGKARTDPTEDVTLFRDLGLDTTSTVLDYGAGTGTFAFAVAPYCERVVAIDVSPSMVGHLSAEAERCRIGNVEPVCAGFLSYDHRGESADFAYSRNALHHLPDFWKCVALERIASALRAGGVLRLRDIVYCFDASETGRRIETWLSGAVTDPLNGWTRDELETHVRDEHSTFSWLLEPMLERAGFEIRTADYAPSGTFGAYTCVKR